MADFIHPAPQATLTSRFGHRTISGKKEWHQGIDLAQSGNVSIRAAAQGKVLRAGELGTYGNVVIIQHTIKGKRMDTTYAHLKAIHVRVGQSVKQGQTIGLMGNTGRSYGQHLHFEIHNGAWATGQPNAVDPWPYILGASKISEKGLNIIKKWEGFRPNAYQDIVAVWTIGFGTTVWSNKTKVKKGDTITQIEAEKLLEKQVNEHARTIAVYVNVPLTQNQYDSLASFQYNLGSHILKNSSLLNYLNARNWEKACEQMLRYNKAGGKVAQGLVNRRKDEVNLFKGNESEVMDMPVYSSPALKKEAEDNLSSAARRKIVVDLALAAGYNKSWAEKLENKTITNDDIEALAMGTLIKMHLDNSNK